MKHPPPLFFFFIFVKRMHKNPFCRKKKKLIKTQLFYHRMTDFVRSGTNLQIFGALTLKRSCDYDKEMFILVHFINHEEQSSFEAQLVSFRSTDMSHLSRSWFLQHCSREKCQFYFPSVR